MYRKNNLLLFLISVLVFLSLFSALMPLSDFDQDGLLDSLVTEGHLLLPNSFVAGRLLFLLIGLPIACLLAIRYSSTPVVPPPIIAPQ